MRGKNVPMKEIAPGVYELEYEPSEWVKKAIEDADRRIERFTTMSELCGPPE